MARTVIDNFVLAVEFVSETVVWFKTALTLEGIPDTARLTGPARPLSPKTLRTEVSELFTTKLSSSGTAETNKSGPLSLNTPSSDEC